MAKIFVLLNLPLPDLDRPFLSVESMLRGLFGYENIKKLKSSANAAHSIEGSRLLFIFYHV